MELIHLYIQIVIIKLYMQVLIFILPTPAPPYQRPIWDYKKADTSNIRKALDLINLFSHKNINAQETVFNETILNIISNYIPNKHITCDDKDPVWMNEKIKSKMKSKNIFYKQYIHNGRKKVIL